MNTVVWKSICCSSENSHITLSKSISRAVCWSLCLGCHFGSTKALFLPVCHLVSKCYRYLHYTNYTNRRWWFLAVLIYGKNVPSIHRFQVSPLYSLWPHKRPASMPPCRRSPTRRPSMSGPASVWRSSSERYLNLPWWIMRRAQVWIKPVIELWYVFY